MVWGKEEAKDYRHSDGTEKYVKYISVRKDNGDIAVFDVNRTIKDSFCRFGGIEDCIQNYFTVSKPNTEERMVMVVCIKSETVDKETDKKKFAEVEFRFPEDVVDTLVARLGNTDSEAND
jgi:hypothetical protein